MVNIKKLFNLFLILLLFPLTAYTNDGFIHNPFKNNYGSLLNYDNFNMFHQISFYSMSSKYSSGSFGTYLNTLQYSIDPNWTAQIHLGKSLNFNSSDNYSFQDNNGFLSGGSLIYNNNKNFTLGVSYGNTPRDFNLISPTSSMLFSQPYSYMSMNSYNNKNLHLWLNKSFKKGSIGINVYYHKDEPENSEIMRHSK